MCVPASKTDAVTQRQVSRGDMYQNAESRPRALRRTCIAWMSCEHCYQCWQLETLRQSPCSQRRFRARVTPNSRTKERGRKELIARRFAMPWQDALLMEPVWQQVSATAPTNPSSLTLAAIGIGTLLLFGRRSRRELGDRSSYELVRRSTTSSDEKRAA